MFTVTVWRNAKLITMLDGINNANKAAELANTLFLTLENVVVEVENKNGDILQRLFKKA